jgi:hypothetical protein
MYLKIMWHEEEEGITSPSGDSESPPSLVVPRHHCIFETNKAEYRKIRVCSMKEFKAWLNTCYTEHSVVGPGIPDEISEVYGMEFLFVKVYDGSKNSGWQNFIAPNCYLYIMNEDGKTIDSLICH